MSINTVHLSPSAHIKRARMQVEPAPDQTVEALLSLTQQPPIDKIRELITTINQIMDAAVPEWSNGYQHISFESIGINTLLRVYHNEKKPTEGTRVDLGSFHMVLFGNSF